MNLENYLKFIFKMNFEIQLAIIAVTAVTSFLLSFIYKKIIPLIKNEEPSLIKKFLQNTSNFIREHSFLLLFIFSLSLAKSIDLNFLRNTILINIIQMTIIILFLNGVLKDSTLKEVPKKLIKIFIFPIIILYFLDLLDDIALILENINITIGSRKISAHNLIRTISFGLILFWISKVINNSGKKLIKSQRDLDSRSKEIFSKTYEISVFVIFVILLLDIIGVDYTALAIFSGAMGVGIGLGLQSVASNFISGIIILLDKSLTIGDHIEFDDGRQGVLQELNMRCATITTYEGKDIIVPNEKFITDSFINWTHQNDEQRYSIKIQVSYQTDLHKLFDILRKALSEHPQVISGEHVPIEKRPDAEINDFCDSGIEILIEFWMYGIDDGENRVAADLRLLIWDTLKEHDIEIPYPQREVRILNKDVIES